MIRSLGKQEFLSLFSNFEWVKQEELLCWTFSLNRTISSGPRFWLAGLAMRAEPQVEVKVLEWEFMEIPERGLIH